MSPNPPLPPYKITSLPVLSRIMGWRAAVACMRQGCPGRRVAPAAARPACRARRSRPEASQLAKPLEFCPLGSWLVVLCIQVSPLRLRGPTVMYLASTISKSAQHCSTFGEGCMRGRSLQCSRDVGCPLVCCQEQHSVQCPVGHLSVSHTCPHAGAPPGFPFYPHQPAGSFPQRWPVQLGTVPSGFASRPPAGPPLAPGSIHPVMFPPGHDPLSWTPMWRPVMPQSSAMPMLQQPPAAQV